MFKSISKLVMTVGTAAAISMGTVAPRPAAAQSQGTINTLLGAAALIGGIILYNNYVHKRQAANSIVGYTANGGTVYGDGRIVMPNGQTYYPNSNGVYPWGTPAYYSSRATTNNYTYDYHRTGQWDHTGRHRGYAYGHQIQNRGRAVGHDRDDHGHGDHGHGDRDHH